jgi:hypothetical protein
VGAHTRHPLGRAGHRELAFSFALPFLPLYLQELGVSDPNSAGLWAGAMSAGFALVMGLMGPVWGVVADRYGRRLMIQRALFGATILIGAMAFVRSPEQLFVLRLLQGGVTGLVAAISTVVSLTVPRERLAASLGLVQTALFTATDRAAARRGGRDLVGFRSPSSSPACSSSSPAFSSPSSCPNRCAMLPLDRRARGVKVAAGASSWGGARFWRRWA